MAYKKIDLVEPIYELQEDETERQHYFVELFYDIDNDNITKFIKSFKGLKRGLEWSYSGSKRILEFNPPKESTFIKWATCLQIKKRRRAYWKDKFKSDREARKKRGEKFLHSFVDDLEQDLKDNREIADEILDHDTLYPHLKAKGKNEISAANNTTWNMYKEVTGVEVATADQNINLNVDADVKQETTAKVKSEKLIELQKRMEKMDYD